MVPGRDYAEFWEKSWREEDEQALAGWLAGWRGHTDPEMELFQRRGVRTVCDAACGFGAHALALASAGFQVSAFDISPRAVELTRAGLQRYGCGDVEVRVAGILETGYPDGAFDAVTAYAVLDHLAEADARRALTELLRIVRPGGLMALSFDTPEEEDFLCPHETLPDGSLVYAEGTSRAGMLFRPCGPEQIDALTAGLRVLRRRVGGRGSRILLLEK